VFQSDGFGPGSLECLDMPAPNECRFRDDLRNRRIDLRLNAQVLGVQVDKGDFHFKRSEDVGLKADPMAQSLRSRRAGLPT
jgi:hypothetical protein